MTHRLVHLTGDVQSPLLVILSPSDIVVRVLGPQHAPPLVQLRVNVSAQSPDEVILHLVEYGVGPLHHRSTLLHLQPPLTLHEHPRRLCHLLRRRREGRDPLVLRHADSAERLGGPAGRHGVRELVQIRHGDGRGTPGGFVEPLGPGAGDATGEEVEAYFCHRTRTETETHHVVVSFTSLLVSVRVRYRSIVAPKRLVRRSLETLLLQAARR